MPRTLTGRTVLVTAATAVVSVIITALVALPIAVRSAGNAARADLADKSAIAVELLTTERFVARQRIVARLREDGISVYLIRRGVADRAGLPPRVIEQIAAGSTVDTRGVVAGESVFIAGRPLTGNDAGVVLTRAASSGTAGQVLGGVWLALLAGLVGGIAAGALLARFIVRPLRQAALAAGRMSAGDRSVRLAVRPPAEAAELAMALNQLGAALQRSEGREREFLLSVSHELRTPLASIRGYAEALADDVVTADQAGETILREAERLDRLISDLLALSRLEADDLPVTVVPVDLIELIDAAAQAWGPRYGPRLSVELPADPVVVDTDPDRIRQVIDGLCENALRVVPSGTPLVLAVRAGEQGGVVEVRDGGPGFTDEDLGVAFQRGALRQRYRHERKTGSGLGLALAARLVTRLGGTIEAGHAPEGGAMFTVTLPYRARTKP
ncbi:HAMP domain-containing sensor histidine kinase [Paractinoplanes maris]|uniref:HAMP domain-containing sensor histidine kinase n=1 Tax=Paractinoplanes maris TaxID=1734446 RepID=UPI0020207DFF|nr:HAMP domain-containing sensor histidine kinase [Actinoplanes maris]